MKGKVKMFNMDRGFGFILGENEEDYFFHISKIKSVDDIERGTIVTFVPTQSEKGNVAIDIKIESNKGKPQFIIFGDTRIRASNIKNYGITKKTVYYIGSNDGLPFEFFLASEVRVDHKRKNSIKKEEDCLYVTTYQGDDFEFLMNDVNFDIYIKCKELDDYFA